jgi:hypothetical protein
MKTEEEIKTLFEDRDRPSGEQPVDITIVKQCLKFFCNT